MARAKPALLLVAIVLVAGCAGGGGLAGGGDGGDATGQADGERLAESGGEDADASATGGPADADGHAVVVANTSATTGTAAVRVQRQLIFTGEIFLRVDRFGAAQANVTRLVRSHGGFVSDATRNVNERDNATWTEGTLVLRVPRQNFTAVYNEVQRVGDVQRATRKSRDVTDRIVDLEARLENLRSERDRLRTLYRRANDTEDVLRVQNRLSEVQGEIERLTAQLRSLRNRVAFASITVHLREESPEPQDEPAWWQTPYTEAFLASIDGVVTTLRAVGVGIAYVLPYAAVFGLPIAGVAAFVRRRGVPSIRGGRRERPVDEDGEDEPDSTDGE